MDANCNRVYVNPNFNRTATRPALAKAPQYSNNYMHVNPNFTRNLPSEHQTSNPHRKIYVNPNFIKPSNKSDEVHMESKMYSYNNKCATDLSYIDNKCYNPTSSISVNSKPLQNNSVCPQSKSKYSLVRNNNRISDKEYPMKESGTVKISKYKSIPMNNFKRNLQIVKNDVAPKQRQSDCHVLLPTQKYIKRSSFKIVKQTLASTNTPVKVSPRYNCLKLKRNVDISLQTKLRTSIAARKKTNIPCRLFTKYGTCLRNLSGVCEYLHDKRHVSLCRKFLKGVCHDKACLLSHELSSKKMPTCYFYLKGMCTKTDCPYLHVKLSEKSKVCQEFMKGYCDKGDECPQRHVRLHENKLSKQKPGVTLSRYKFNRTVKVTISKINKTSLSKRQQTQVLRKRSETENVPSCKNEQDDTSDICRYFKEDLQRADVTCEVLMPTRCKLGTLPSFIQL